MNTANNFFRPLLRRALVALRNPSGVPALLTGCLVLMQAYLLCVATGHVALSRWVAMPAVVLAVAYCLPWGLLRKATPAAGARP